MSIRIAWRALGRNKVRTFLTMLGLIIGVAAVIAMVALGQGARESIQAQIASLGTNVLYLTPGAANQGGVRAGNGTILKLKVGEVEAISRECPSVKYVSALVRRNFQVSYTGQNWFTSVQGVGTDYFLIREWDVVQGATFTDMDVTGSSKVCVIGKIVRDNLFAGEDPLGHSVRIRGVPFRVVGLLAEKGQNSFGQEQDDVILCPYSTLMKRLARTDRVDQIMMSAVSEPRVATAQDEVAAMMRQRHHIKDPKDDDFIVRTQADAANAAEESSRIFTWLLAGIASISLLVGGIGIMNIMLVSVTERIREIGTRMAVGARQSDILTQFFVEALVISMLGGAIGILLGVGASELAARISPWSPIVSVASIFLAFGCSGAVGLFFGFYPAWKASQLDPIEALRHE